MKKKQVNCIVPQRYNFDHLIKITEKKALRIYQKKKKDTIVFVNGIKKIND